VEFFSSGESHEDFLATRALLEEYRLRASPHIAVLPSFQVPSHKYSTVQYRIDAILYSTVKYNTYRTVLLMYEFAQVNNRNSYCNSGCSATALLCTHTGVQLNPNFVNRVTPFFLLYFFSLQAHQQPA